ncbi:MAG: tRNA (adenosine(37)-N6)-dimethylallyltransferase MiaA [Cyanobacteria bacterium NC_groundwater_1444_Ag_S-0.65um_54_12]|nr:tRNA (adenosine(37)-N6)-dimethylallyltransferase MiaA [Cyanobacteria bacterium NC_groundwater_1444_Ag_S-0.65um_54_12]
MPLLPLVVIGGPTASGKSELAMELAKHFSGVIITADSRQVYRDFDIGTCKPTPAERAVVPHELLDIAEPTEVYTVARFRQDAQAAIWRARQTGHLPFLVGGTGFYIRAALGETAIPPVPPDPFRRAALMNLPDLWQRLQVMDPATANRLHPNDKFRLARALEVLETTGKPLSSWVATPAPYQVCYLVVSRDREELAKRIDQRILALLEIGWRKEITELLARYGPDLPLWRTLGYAELLQEHNGIISTKTAIDLIGRNTRRYAKRQFTWFRGEVNAKWLPPARHGKLDDCIAAAITQIETLLAHS